MRKNIFKVSNISQTQITNPNILLCTKTAPNSKQTRIKRSIDQERDIEREREREREREKEREGKEREKESNK